MSVMAELSLDDVLTRHGVGMTSTEFVAELDSILDRMAPDDEPPLTADEIKFLREYGGPGVTEVLAKGLPDESQVRARRAANLIAYVRAATMSVGEAALLLGVDCSHISDQLSRGTLWAFCWDRSLRIPRWQFTKSGLLPGLPAIIAAIPDDLAPQSVDGFMHTPQDELDDLTPIDYLTAGGDPQPVADILTALDKW